MLLLKVVGYLLLTLMVFISTVLAPLVKFNYLNLFIVMTLLITWYIVVYRSFICKEKL
jgi:hypothetical protein